MALSSPIEAFLQAAQAKERNRQQSLQDLQGVGQNIGQGFNTIGQAMQRKKLVEQLKANPQTAPYAQLAAMYPEQFVQNVLPKLIPKSSNSPELDINPDGSISVSGMPIGGQPQQPPQPKQPPVTAGIDGAMGSGGPPPTPPKGPRARIPITGNKAVDLITKGVGGNKPTVQQDLRQKMIDAMNKRTDVLSQKSQFGQIDRIAKATGIQPAVIKQIQTNNVRADRALSVLSGTVYPQKFNLALIDLAGIMQGGSPQLAELHGTSFPTFQENIARLKLYATGDPKTPIPKQAVDEVRKLVQDLKEVDNNYIRQNAKFQSQMLGPTIQGFQKNFSPVIQQGTENFIQGGVKSKGQSDPLGLGL